MQRINKGWGIYIVTENNLNLGCVCFYVKWFLSVKYFQVKIFFEKENIFRCLVAFWKIFFSVWLCSWKYHRKHIFYLLLTFSQLPNKYIISFLNSETQKKQNPKKKKNHQIRSNWEKKEEREATGFDLEARSCGGGEGEIAWWRRRRDHAAEATRFYLKVRSRGGGVGKHDQTGFIGDGFEAARSDRRGCGSGTGFGLHRW